ncbi:MAG: hypothetical protein BGO55_25470 [Sphingobacteriales bacterium 50-39]|nr:hypothetical protein [Sphingobacteriales bacterium]OJW58625.1 MAG: hypothetical protein BGO55_25470 [Sphingobacteriales bacterium 50-39]
MKHLLMALCMLAGPFFTVQAQDTTSKALTMAEYEKAKSFSPADLDKDSYVKFENAYILDRNDFGKPYFITGDDGLKKRIDLYKLIRKEGRMEIGTVIFYTTETGRRYMACLPGFRADGKIWEKYFEDIHAIDKEEKNFVLKLSYVLSRELGFQLYRAGVAGQSSERERRESGTYGNDICFPGNTLVTMAGGKKRVLSEVRAGDAIVTVDPATNKTRTVEIKELTVHSARNYAITRLLLVNAQGEGRDIKLSSRLLQATPNHPILTAEGEKKIGELKVGDKITSPDGVFAVWDKEESAGGVQKVYNIVAASGSMYIMDGVPVLQKSLKN